MTVIDRKEGAEVHPFFKKVQDALSEMPEYKGEVVTTFQCGNETYSLYPADFEWEIEVNSIPEYEEPKETYLVSEFYDTLQNS